jgi:hypothetical protein
MGVAPGHCALATAGSTGVVTPTQLPHANNFSSCRQNSSIPRAVFPRPRDVILKSHGSEIRPVKPQGAQQAPLDVSRRNGDLEATPAPLHGTAQSTTPTTANAGLARGLDWEELLSTPEPEIFGPRARSARCVPYQCRHNNAIRRALDKHILSSL